MVWATSNRLCGSASCNAFAIRSGSSGTGSAINFVLGFGPVADRFLGPDVPARFDLVDYE